MEYRHSTLLPNNRVLNAQHLLLLMALLVTIWAVVFAPHALAASPLEKPAAVPEKILPKKENIQSNLININTADAPALAAGLDGIGIKKAEAIVAHREKNGKFATLEQLLDVKGIGQATLDKNRDKISL